MYKITNKTLLLSTIASLFSLFTILPMFFNAFKVITPFYTKRVSLFTNIFNNTNFQALYMITKILFIVGLVIGICIITMTILMFLDIDTKRVILTISIILLLLGIISLILAIVLTNKVSTSTFKVSTSIGLCFGWTGSFGAGITGVITGTRKK